MVKKYHPSQTFNRQDPSKVSHLWFSSCCHSKVGKATRDSFVISSGRLLTSKSFSNRYISTTRVEELQLSVDPLMAIHVHSLLCMSWEPLSQKVPGPSKTLDVSSKEVDLKYWVPCIVSGMQLQMCFVAIKVQAFKFQASSAEYGSTVLIKGHTFHNNGSINCDF